LEEEKRQYVSVQNFEKAMSLWPKDELSQDYYILFSTQYFIVGDTLKALEVINNKIDNDKKLYLLNPDDYILKGNVYLNSKKYPEARKAYEESLKFNMKMKNAYLGLATLELLDDKLMESNNYINKAYDLDKEYYMNYALFGIITLMADDKEQAKNALSKAKELKPDDKDIRELYDAFFGGE
jgi:tetratricopeptide (TPR) repeat protein